MLFYFSSFSATSFCFSYFVSPRSYVFPLPLYSQFLVSPPLHTYPHVSLFCFFWRSRLLCLVVYWAVYMVLKPGGLNEQWVLLTQCGVMEQGPSSEADSHWASQEIPHLWNPKVQYRVHKSPPLSPSWTRFIHSTHFHPISLRSILILSSHLRLGLPNALPFRFWDQNLIYIFHFPTRASYAALSSLPPFPQAHTLSLAPVSPDM